MEEQRERIRKTIRWDHIFPFEDAREDQMNMIKAPLKYFSTFPVILLVAPNGKGKTATSIAIAINKLQWNEERIKANQSHNENMAKLLEGENIEKVFFIDRTTRQTDNFILTLNILNEKRKKNGIKPIRVVEWTSRNNLCINPYCLANKNSGIDYACKSTIRTDRWETKKWCIDPDNSQTEFKIIDYVPNDIPIVADRKSLVKYGIESNICPYYLSRQIQDKDSCDVIVGNYNYVFDPFTREAIQLDVQNSLIIVDECLTEDTLISMQNGDLKFIKDVQNGDEVVGGVVSNIFKKTVNKLIKIKSSFGTLITSENHPNFIIRTSKIDKYNKKIEILKSKDLKKGFFILIPDILHQNIIPLTNYTYEQLYFVGMIMCDGHLDKGSDKHKSNRTKIELYNQDKIQIFESIFVNIVKSLDSSSIIKQNSKLRNLKNSKYFTKTIWTNSIKVREFLYKFDILPPKGKKSNIININKEILTSSNEAIKGFIQSCFDCEGWVNTKKKCVSFSSTSDQFIEKIKLLLLRFGIQSSIIKREKNNLKHNSLFYLNITGSDIIKYKNQIGFLIPYKLERLNSIVNQRQSTRYKNRPTYKQTFSVNFNGQIFHLIPIKEIEVINTTSTVVYDFTTTSHSFISNGILTHNCHNIEKVIESALKREITLPQVDNLLKNPKLGIEIIHFLKKVRLFIVAIMSLFEKRTINNHQTMINYNEFGENLKRYDINIEEIGKLSKALFALSTNMNLFQYLQRLVNIVSFFSIYFVFTSNAFISYAYKNENDTILGIQSFDIAPIVKTLIDQNCKILFMTGTIKPSMFQFQLGLEENVSIKTFVYPTPTRNMKTVLINKGVLGNNLSTDFANREENVIRDYGETLITLLEATPDSGSLIFFPSEPFKKQCITVWTKYGIMIEFGMKKYLINKKTNNKIPILDDIHTGEVSDGDNSNKIISQYKKFASTRKMVLFSIMRGRASEGEDYPNGEARSVFVIGIPLADVTSPSVSRKIEYYNNKKPNSGWEWLMSDAINAVNQAVGRMIRNDKKDYGVAYLLDARYVNDPSILPYLSDWIVERIDKNEISIPILQLNEKINKFYLQNQKKT